MSKRKETKPTDRQIITLIHELVESDAGFESDMVLMDKLQGRKISEREIILAELVSKIYKIVHPRFGCRHYNWEKETLDAINSLTKNKYGK